MGEGENRPGLLAWSLLIVLSLIWGTSFILVKKGLVALSPGEVGALRIVAASAFLSPIALKNLYKISKKDWKILFVVGLAGTFFPAFLFAIAQTNLDSSLAGVFNALTPLWVWLIGVFVFKASMKWQQLLGVTMGLIGTVTLMFAGSGGNFDQLNYYALFVIMATVLYGINLNVIKRFLGHIKARVITSISVLFVGPFALVHLLLFTGFTDKMNVVPGFWLSTFYIILLGVMSTAIALVIFNQLVQMTTPIFTSSVTYILPIVAIGWGVLDGEILLLTHYIGISIIILGIYLVNK